MPREPIAPRLAAAAVLRVAQQAVRVRRAARQRQAARLVFDGKPLLNFCSNDYLGLAQHPQAIAALQDSAQKFGVGSGASDVVCGHTVEHAALEREVAQWLNYPRALLLGSGYMANLAVAQSLLRAGDICLQDKLNHASLLDAARLAQTQLVRYPHRDIDSARRQARTHADGALLLASDGVFSMDGDIAPLRELAALAREQDGLLYVDEAHAIGVIGPEGRGSAAAAGLDASAAPLLLVTLGKALGGYGALLVGQDALIEHIAQVARPHLYTTALPPALAAAARVAVRLARDEAWRRERLAELIARFRDGARTRGIPLMESSTPIQPLLIGDNARALQLAQQLEARGMLVIAIRPPTVAAGQARLRITLSAAHSSTDVDVLLDALAALLANADACSAVGQR